jgi:prepilin peptidase CpaA
VTELAAVGWGGILTGSCLGLTAAVLLGSCWIDVRYRLVCDEACIAAAVASVLLFLTGKSLGGWVHLGAIAGIATMIFALFAARLLGGGDLKLIVALLPGLGPWPLLVFVVWTSLAGGLLAIAYRIARFMLRARENNSRAQRRSAARHPRASHSLQRWLRHEKARIRRGKSLPYVPAIAAGWLIAQLSS